MVCWPHSDSTEVSEALEAAPLASFEAKWSVAYPELPVALRFVAQQQRRTNSAFECLVHELEHAAFAIRDAEPAMIKLQWWAEEFTRLGTAAARHPLTQALVLQPGFVALPIAHWHEVIVGAMAQRDPEPAPDRAALLRGYAALYGPLGVVEAALFPAVSAAASAQVRTTARALRETATLAEALGAGRLPLPLDLLARHRLARGDLARRSPQQVAMLREWLAALAADRLLPVDAGTRLGVLNAASASADRWRAALAAHTSDPLASLNAALARVPLRSVWAGWRAGLRSRR